VRKRPLWVHSADTSGRRVSNLELEEYLAYAMAGGGGGQGAGSRRMGEHGVWGDTSFSYRRLRAARRTFVWSRDGQRPQHRRGGLPGKHLHDRQRSGRTRPSDVPAAEQMTRGWVHRSALGHLSSKMKDAVKTADATSRSNRKPRPLKRPQKRTTSRSKAINGTRARRGGAGRTVSVFLRWSRRCSANRCSTLNRRAWETLRVARIDS